MFEGKRIVNLTPHEVIVFSTKNDSVLARFPPAGPVARVKVKESLIGSMGNIPLVKTSYSNVSGLPEKPEPDTLYIVSLLVAQALEGDPEWSGRLLVPNTGPTSLGAVRDEKGRIRASARSSFSSSPLFLSFLYECFAV